MMVMAMVLMLIVEFDSFMLGRKHPRPCPTVGSVLPPVMLYKPVCCRVVL